MVIFYLKQLWQDKGWETLLDYLRYYNEMDVRPFLNAILVYLNALCQHCVNPLLTCYSLPGVAKKILSGYMPPGGIHYIGDEKLFNLMKKAEVGGQSIIMTRENPPTHPYIVGYDACSLYLSSFGKDHFIGQPTFYENKESGILEKIPISQSKFDKKRLTTKISSEYFEIIQKVDYPSQFITKEYQIKLSSLERMYIQDKYDYYEIPLKAPKNFFVDGIIKSGGRKIIFEFDGCYYHACNKSQVCETKSQSVTYKRIVQEQVEVINEQTGKIGKQWIKGTKLLTSEQVRMIDIIRDEILVALGYQVIRQAECEWRTIRLTNENYPKALMEINDYENLIRFWPGTDNLIPTEHILNLVRKGKINGIIFVNIETPEHLKMNYEQFAPIIKHASITLDDIGSYMQRIAFENNIKFPSEGRKMVIDSYFGENVGITCESLKHLLEMGLEVTKILAFIRYKPFPIFKPFVDKITRLRMQGDVDKDKAIIANIAKLLGNSAFGSCITDVEKHREVIMYVIDGNERIKMKGSYLKKDIASRKMFKTYEVITQNLIEITRRKKKIILNQLRQISNVIFDKSKMTMRKFIEFCFTVLKKDSYRFMSTDTDSIYIAFKDGPNFTDNLDPDKLEFFEQEKHKYFVTSTAMYGERTPGLFKVEARGKNMVALCAKSYVVFDEHENTLKFSSKGVQKSTMYELGKELSKDEDYNSRNTYKNVFKVYQDQLQKGKTQQIINRGMKRTNDVFTTYEQEKKCNTNFYCKRRVLDDGVTTVPLDI